MILAVIVTCSDALPYNDDTEENTNDLSTIALSISNIIKLRRPDRGVVNEPLKVWLPRCKASKRSSITYKHTSIQTYKHTSIQTYKHTSIQTYKHTSNKHTNIQTYKHTNIQTYKHTNIQTYKHTNIQTYKQQTYKHTSIQTYSRWIIIIFDGTLQDFLPISGVINFGDTQMSFTTRAAPSRHITCPHQQGDTVHYERNHTI